MTPRFLMRFFFKILRNFFLLFFATLALCGVAGWLTVQPTQAASITVTSLADTTGGPDCTLRDAIKAVNTGATSGGCSAGGAGPYIINFNVTGSIILGNQLPTITTPTAITLSGPGATQLTISGNNVTRILALNNTANLTIQNLTIANGKIIGTGNDNTNQYCISNNDFGFGAGVYNNGGTLSLIGVVMNGNAVKGYDTNSTSQPGGNGCGGAIYSNNNGKLNITGSTFINNTATGGNSGNDGGNGRGSAIFNYTGSVYVTATTFSNNLATGGNSGVTNNSKGGDAIGTAIYNDSGRVDIDGNSLFSGNIAQAGNINTACNPQMNQNQCGGGAGAGGGVYNNGTTVITNAIFASNVVTGGDGSVYGGAGWGGGIFNNGGILTTTNTTFNSNQAKGGNYSSCQNNLSNSCGGGGALLNNSKGTAAIISSTFQLNTAINNGGAIQNIDSGNLQIIGSSFSNNKAGSGGAIINVFNNSTTSITKTLFLNNRGEDDYNVGTNNMGNGGAINNQTLMTVTDTIFQDNSVTHGGGAITNSYEDARLFLINSSFISNTALNDVGGGIVNIGRVFITSTQQSVAKEAGSLFSNNQALKGGAIANVDSGLVDVNYTTFSGNQASDSGGVFFNTNIITISRSTLVTNTAGNKGGGVYLETGQASLVNSTFSQNSTSSPNSNGGAVYNASVTGTIGITNSTFVSNTAPTASALYNYGQASLANTILTGGTGNCTGTITNNGHNLQFPDNSCGNNISVADPRLDGLKNNGGPTLTHALLAGSPALDAGDNAICNSPLVNNIDQRGFLRIGNPNNEPGGGTICDIGAFEQAVTVLPTSFNSGTTGFEGNQVFQSPVLNTYNNSLNLNFDTCFHVWDWRDTTTNPLRSPGTGQAGYAVNGAKSAALTSNQANFQCDITVPALGVGIQSDKVQPRARGGGGVGWRVSTGNRVIITAYDSQNNAVATRTVEPNLAIGQATQIWLYGNNIVRIHFQVISPNGQPTRCDLSTNVLFNNCVVMDDLQVGENLLDVTNPNDTGSVNVTHTLSSALSLAQSGDTITFAVPGNVINLNQPLPTLRAGVKLDAGACSASNRVTIHFNNTPGLVLPGQNLLQNLTLQGASQKSLFITGPGNVLRCTNVSKP